MRPDELSAADATVGGVAAHPGDQLARRRLDAYIAWLQREAQRRQWADPNAHDPAVDEITLSCAAYDEGERALASRDLERAADRFRVAAGWPANPEADRLAGTRPAVLGLIETLLQQGEQQAARAWRAVAASDGLGMPAAALMAQYRQRDL